MIRKGQPDRGRYQKIQQGPGADLSGFLLQLIHDQVWGIIDISVPRLE